MTGGYRRNQASGLNASNNARGSLVKNILLSASRRLSTSALQLSEYGSPTSRSEENVSLPAHGETAFDERTTAHAIFLASSIDAPGRLRTSSLTMDVTHKSKDMDSGNSSLIDSSSADSYQELGSGSRSLTNSSSKSVQSLSSVNQTEYEMNSNRKRHPSSVTGSSGKVSLIASDITENSEESSDKNTETIVHPSRFYIQEDTYLDSESQPFLYRPHLDSFRFPDGDGNYRNDSDIQDNASIDDCGDEHFEYPANEESDLFNSTIIMNADDVDHHVVMDRSFKIKKSRPPKKNSFGDGEPLLRDFVARSERKEDLFLELSRQSSQLPLRRTSSMGNLTHIPHSSMDTTDTLDLTSCFPASFLTSDTKLTSCFPTSFVSPDTRVTSRVSTSSVSSDSKVTSCFPTPFVSSDTKVTPCVSKTPANSDTRVASYLLTSSVSSATRVMSYLPSPPVSSDTKVASSVSISMPQHKRISDFQPFHVIDSQPYHNFRLNPHTSQDNPPAPAPHPTQLPPDSVHIHPSHLEYSTKGNPHSKYISADTQYQVCSNQHANPRASLEASTPSPNDSSCDYTARNPDENCFMKNSCSSGASTDTSSVDNSAIKNPVQNLTSVLGHGSPVSVSVLKQGLKLLKCEKDKPLQVLVPRSKVPAQTTSRRHVAADMMAVEVPCPGKAQLEHVTLHVRNNPEGKSLQSPTTAANVHPKEASSSFTRDELSLQNESYPRTILQNSAVYSPIGVPKYNQTVLSFGDTHRKESPQNMYNERTSKDECVSLINRSQDQPNRTKHSQHGFFAPFCNMRDTNHKQMRKTVHSCPSYYGGSESEPILSPTNHAMPGTRQTKSKVRTPLMIHSRCTSQQQVHTSAQRTFPEQHIRQSLETPHVCATDPSYSATKSSDTSDKNHSPNSATHPPSHLYHSDETKLHSTTKEIMNDGGDVNQAQIGDNGHRPNMILRVPKACFVSDFVGSHGKVNTSKSNSSLGHSVPSSIDSGHAENNDGFLHSSNTSQLGLLKACSKTQRQCEYFNREIPDYRYLCTVATIMNPVFGLVALVCNHFAQRNLRLQRRTRANNLYFATIAISTVSIFLTLIAGALFIAHNIVLQSEKSQSSAADSAQSCEGRFFGYDDSLKKFFDVDLELYCIITKNEKIMEALKRFWLEDTHIKMKYSKQRSNTSEEATTNGSKSTGEAFRDIQVRDREESWEITPNNRTFLDGKDADRAHGTQDTDLSNADASRMPVSSAKNSTFNSSLPRSAKDPIIPPGLEGQYERFLFGEQRSDMNNDGRPTLQSILSHDMPSHSASWNRSAERTTVSIVYGLAGNTTVEDADSHVGSGPGGS